MDEINTGESSLYETDFYAWTQQQAALMKEGCLADLDLMNVLEEIESLGRKEVSELRSKADSLFETAYADARRLAASETGLPIATFPIMSPFSRELMQSDDWYPTPPAGFPDIEPAAGG